MKLLFDQNLSPKLVQRLSDLFPGSEHVQSLKLDCAEDDAIWEFCRKNGFAVVSKDEDYNNMSVLKGPPPKVIWLELGNCSTNQIEAAFRARIDEVRAFEKDPTIGTLVLA